MKSKTKFQGSSGYPKEPLCLETHIRNLMKLEDEIHHVARISVYGAHNGAINTIATNHTIAETLSLHRLMSHWVYYHKEKPPKGSSKYFYCTVVLE